MTILIAAPIGDGKEYSINEFFDYVVNQDLSDVEIALCVNGKSDASIRKKIAMLKMVELTHKSGSKIPLNILKLNYKESYSLNERLIYSRESIRQYAIEFKDYFSHIYWMDTDTIPNRSQDIKVLLDAKKDFISGVYFYKASRQPVIISLGGVNVTLEKLSEQHSKKEVFKIWGCGYGALLMSRKVFETCEFEWSVHKDDWSDDFAHCEVVEKKGFNRWCSAEVVCRHYRKEDFTVVQGSEDVETKIDQGTKNKSA